MGGRRVLTSTVFHSDGATHEHIIATSYTAIIFLFASLLSCFVIGRYLSITWSKTVRIYLLYFCCLTIGLLYDTLLIPEGTKLMIFFVILLVIGKYIGLKLNGLAQR